MKVKFLFLSSLLALTGCGGGDPIDAVTAGDEVSESVFEQAFSLDSILLHSNCHAEVTYNQTGLPEQAHVTYARQMDFANKKVKVLYNRVNEPYYFDFTRSNGSNSFTFDLYSPQVNNTTVPYTVRTYENAELSNEFMGINSLLTVTDGVGLTFISGLDYSDFSFSGGVYQLKEPIEQTQMGVTMYADVVRVSFNGNTPKDIYFHTYGDVPTSATETVRMTAEARIILSQFGQVSITLPEVVDL